ncbi:MAG: YggT family protein [Deferribacterota bacterium]|nr:YggT family protein [Deferribacterota bacterium]
MTNQELIFNPIGKFVANITNPIFTNLLQNYPKEKADKFIPLIICIVIFFLGIIYWLFLGGSPLYTIIKAYIDSVLFIYFFYILSLIVGCLVGTEYVSFISTFFHRIGLPVVKISRKIVPIRGNKIIIISIILLTACYIAVEGLLIYIISNLDLNNAFLLSINYIFSSLTFLLRLYTWLIIIRVLLSWVAPDPYNTIVQIIYSLTEPIMAPFRKIIPPLGFIDISPILLIFIIEFIRVLLIRISMLL